MGAGPHHNVGGPQGRNLGCYCVGGRAVAWPAETNLSWPPSAYRSGRRPAQPAGSPSHLRHKLYRRQRVADFGGRRLHSEITRCDSCGGVFVWAQQYAVKRGQS